MVYCGSGTETKFFFHNKKIKGFYGLLRKRY